MGYEGKLHLLALQCLDHIRKPCFLPNSLCLAGTMFSKSPIPKIPMEHPRTLCVTCAETGKRQNSCCELGVEKTLLTLGLWADSAQLGGRALVWHTQGPRFNLWSYKKQKPDYHPGKGIPNRIPQLLVWLNTVGRQAGCSGQGS